MDPTDRHTVWGLLIGCNFTWLAVYGVSQAMVQRYLTLPTEKKARAAIWINLPGTAAFLIGSLRTRGNLEEMRLSRRKDAKQDLILMWYCRTGFPALYLLIGWTRHVRQVPRLRPSTVEANRCNGSTASLVRYGYIGVSIQDSLSNPTQETDLNTGGSESLIIASKRACKSSIVF